MSRKGGYKIIDLKNKPLKLNIGMVYDGIYEEIESTTKSILISGLNIDGEEIKDFYCVPRLQGTDYIFTYANYTLTIKDTDVVTIGTL